MTEQIFIEGLEVEAIIGVLPHERTTPQPLLIDVTLTTDITTAAQSTHLADTIDYADVCEQIKTLCQREEALLLETLANQNRQHALPKCPSQRAFRTHRKAQSRRRRRRRRRIRSTHTQLVGVRKCSL